MIASRGECQKDTRPLPYTFINPKSFIVMPKVGFRLSVFKYTRYQIKQGLIQSVNSSKEMREEMRMIFQRANRRIQNIEAKGYLSPALEALHLQEGHGYTVFSMKADTWATLKTRYLKAVEFLRQPTSTAMGAHDYEKHLQHNYDLTDEEMGYMKDHIRGKMQSVDEVEFVERYLMRYKDFTGELETTAKDIADQIEQDAMATADQLEAALDSEAAKIEAAMREQRAALEKTMKNAISIGKNMFRG